MKKVIRTMAAVALLFATTSGKAKEAKSEPKLETDGTSKSILFEWDAHLVKTTVRIFDKEGKVFYKDYVADVDAYAKKFDLTALDQGAYFLKVENRLREVLYSISVNKNDIVILAKEEIHKPVFRNDKGLVHMNLLNLEEKEVSMSVLDSNGNILFDETITDSYLVGKTFNFKRAFEDDYTIVIENSKRTFYETIAIK